MWLDGLEIKSKRKKPKRRKTKNKKRSRVTVSARVKEKRADRRRKLWLGLLVMVSIVMVGWMVRMGLDWTGRALFSENDRYLIRHWDLRSNGILTPAHIKEYSQLTEEDNLFAVDLKAVRRRLESVAVINSVRISRQLPDTLVVRVTERLAVARLGKEQHLPLAVDRDGQVLGPNSLSPRLPVIVGLRQPGLRPGMKVSDAHFADALRLLEWCDRAHTSYLVQPREIHIGDPDLLKLVLDNQVVVTFDRKYLEERMTELVGILQSEGGTGRLGKRINMTGDPRIPPVAQF